MTKQRLMYLGLAAWALLCYNLLVVAGISAGNLGYFAPVLAVLSIWLASPLMMLWLRAEVETRFVKKLFSHRRQSWAFMYGDSIFLPIAAFGAAYGWMHLDRTRTQWYMAPWWAIAAAIIGLLAGLLFHKMDVTGYRKLGYGLALLSPTKMGHDFVAYPVLFGGLLFLGVPVMFGPAFMPAGIMVIVGVVLWLAMGIADGLRGLYPGDMHPKWSAAHFTALV